MALYNLIIYSDIHDADFESYVGDGLKLAATQDTKVFLADNVDMETSCVNRLQQLW